MTVAILQEGDVVVSYIIYQILVTLPSSLILSKVQNVLKRNVQATPAAVFDSSATRFVSLRIPFH